MKEIDIWRSAAQFIKTHGKDAALNAARRADTLLEAGNTEGFLVWKGIVAAITELERQAPHTSEPMN